MCLMRNFPHTNQSFVAFFGIHGFHPCENRLLMVDVFRALALPFGVLFSVILGGCLALDHSGASDV